MAKAELDLSDVELSAGLEDVMVGMEKAGVAEELGLVMKKVLKPVLEREAIKTLNIGSSTGAAAGYVHAVGIVVERLDSMLKAAEVNDVPEERRSAYKRLMNSIMKELADILNNREALLAPLVEELREKSFDKPVGGNNGS